jgi:hypothetical protein
MRRSPYLHQGGELPVAANEDGDACRPMGAAVLDVALAEPAGSCGTDGGSAPSNGPGAGAAAPVEHSPNCGLFQDIPRSIWTVFLSGWAGFFLLMWLFFATGPVATFMVTVVILFGLMAFGLPVVMAALSNRAPVQTNGIIQTHNGPVSVGAAGVQIALIPVAVVIGLLAFILFARP